MIPKSLTLRQLASYLTFRVSPNIEFNLSDLASCIIHDTSYSHPSQHPIRTRVEMGEFEGWLRASLPRYLDAIMKVQRNEKLTLLDLSGTHFDDLRTVNIPGIEVVLREYVPPMRIQTSSSDELEQTYMKKGHPRIFSKLANPQVLDLLEIYDATMTASGRIPITPLHPLRNPFTKHVLPEDIVSNVAKELEARGLVNVVQTPIPSDDGLSPVFRLEQEYHHGLDSYIFDIS